MNLWNEHNQALILTVVVFCGPFFLLYQWDKAKDAFKDRRNNGSQNSDEAVADEPAPTPPNI